MEDEDEDEEGEGEGFTRAKAWGGKGGASATDRYGNKVAKKKDGKGDMEVTFHAGLEEFGARMKKRKEEGRLGKGAKKETVWEKEVRERQEKLEKKKADKKLGVKKPVEAEKNVGGGDSGGGGGGGGDGGGGGFDDDFFMGGGAETSEIQLMTPIA